MEYYFLYNYRNVDDFKHTLAVTKASTALSADWCSGIILLIISQTQIKRVREHVLMESTHLIVCCRVPSFGAGMIECTSKQKSIFC